MQVRALTVGPFGVSCYVVSEGAGARADDDQPAMVVDPGSEAERILEVVRRDALRVVLIVNTHGHGDHIGANQAMKAAFPEAVLAVHREAAALLADPVRNLSAAFGYRATSPPPDRLLRDGDTLQVGGLIFEVMHVPGHSPGGICLGRRAVDDDPPALFTGDALFAGGIGRTDFPDSHHASLMRGLRERILAWPDETVVYPGHGPATTIGQERRSNPFLA